MKSIFTLAPQLKENFILITPEFINEADVILVNADNPENILEWEKVTRLNNLTSSLMLTDQGDTNLGDLAIQRPIRVQKLIAALEDIVEQTSVDIGPPDSVAELCVMVVDDSFPVRKFMEHKLNDPNDAVKL